MKKIEFNKDGLQLSEIDKTVRKVRAFVVNHLTNQVLLVHYAGLFMLPGGSIDEEETELQALTREIVEEAGIVIDESQAIPFLRMESFDKNYFDRKSGTINRLTETTFFEVSTSEAIDESKKKLTESEKDKEHRIFFVDLDMIEDLVESNQTDNKKKEQFDREILVALNEYLDYRSKKNNNEEGKGLRKTL